MTARPSELQYFFNWGTIISMKKKMLNSKNTEKKKTFCEREIAYVVVRLLYAMCILYVSYVIEEARKKKWLCRFCTIEHVNHVNVKLNSVPTFNMYRLNVPPRIVWLIGKNHRETRKFWIRNRNFVKRNSTNVQIFQ